jgi:hypothetical protein
MVLRLNPSTLLSVHTSLISAIARFLADERLVETKSFESNAPLGRGWPDESFPGVKNARAESCRPFGGGVRYHKR